jgi:hypothetical protein
MINLIFVYSLKFLTICKERGNSISEFGIFLEFSLFHHQSKKQGDMKEEITNLLFPEAFIFPIKVYFSVHWSVLLFNGSLHCCFKGHNISK